MRRPIVWLALLVAALLAAMAAKSWMIELPPVRADNSNAQFSAERAAERLEFVLGDQRPHPADTPANDMVRGKIVALLQSMGLRPIVRDQVACNELYKARGVSCARVRNVIAVLGPQTGKAVLLNAHYDSVPMGPGAGDDGILCLDTRDGKRLWKFAGPFHVDSNPAVVGDRLYAGSGVSRTNRLTEAWCLDEVAPVPSSLALARPFWIKLELRVEDPKESAAIVGEPVPAKTRGGHSD